MNNIYILNILFLLIVSIIIYYTLTLKKKAEYFDLYNLNDSINKDILINIKNEVDKLNT